MSDLLRCVGYVCSRSTADAVAMSVKPNESIPNPDSDFDYGNPPKHSQFKKGTSGNPKGRRKKDPFDLRSCTERMLDKKVILKDGRRMTNREANVRLIFKGAFSGNRKAFRQFLSIIKKAGLLPDRPLPSIEGGVMTLPDPFLQEFRRKKAMQRPT